MAQTFAIVVYTMMGDHQYARLIRPEDEKPLKIVFEVQAEAETLTSDVKLALINKARAEAKRRKLKADEIIGLEPFRTPPHP